MSANMTSTELNLGLRNESRTSSRVLKPPGGGHSDIFAPPEVKTNPPRPKYDQQNSSNLNCVMNTADPNIKVKKFEVNETVKQSPVAVAEQDQKEDSKPEINNENQNQNNNNSAPCEFGESGQASSRGRVPPGGFSAGFW